MNDENFGYLYVLDYCYPGIYEIKLTEEDNNVDTEKLLNKYNLKKDACDFMFSENKLELETLNE